MIIKKHYSVIIILAIIGIIIYVLWSDNPQIESTPFTNIDKPSSQITTNNNYSNDTADLNVNNKKTNAHQINTTPITELPPNFPKITPLNQQELQETDKLIQQADQIIANMDELLQEVDILPGFTEQEQQQLEQIKVKNLEQIQELEQQLQQLETQND